LKNREKLVGAEMAATAEFQVAGLSVLYKKDAQTGPVLERFRPDWHQLAMPDCCSMRRIVNG
jgi:hypothetical protein